MPPMPKDRRKLKGFSLAEVLLSIMVLLFGMLPILQSMVGGTRTSIGSRDIIVASELAQEGIELVKNIKDNNARAATPLEPVSWLPDATGSSWNDCRINYDDAAVSSVGTRISCGYSSFVLSQSSPSSPFRHGSGGTASKFNRRLFISYDTSNKTVTCLSVVYWGTETDAPTTMANAKSKCIQARSCVSANTGTPSSCIQETRQCVYAETELTPWETP